MRRMQSARDPMTRRRRSRHSPAGSATRRRPARFASLYDGVATKIFGRLPDATWVYPGHGADTTLGAERPHLEEWRARGW
jgi:glyoxylase-like metal-dependent hydrolase (beta-lactamase superfamily II)